MDDFVLNVRQIGSYPQLTPGPADAILFQQGGLGGPYAWTSPANLVNPVIAPLVTTNSIQLADASWITWGANIRLQASAAIGFIFSIGSAVPFSVGPTGNATITGTLSVGRDPLTPFEVATQNYVDATVTAAKQLITDNSVWTVNGRGGNVQLTWFDLIQMGGAPINSPAFQGTPTAPTISDLNQHDWQIPTTAWVQDVVNCQITALLHAHPFVWSFNGRTGDITLTDADLAGLSIVLPESPAFTGTPTTPTPPLGDNSTIVANTEFVQTAINGLSTVYAPINSPSFTGMPTAPTAAPGSSTGQIATTAFVAAAVAAATAGVASFNGRTGIVTLDTADITGAGGATLVSPVFTGTPQAPTATPGTDTTQIATTAFVVAAVTAVTAGVTSFNTRTGAVTLTAGDVTGAGGAPLNSPAFTGVPTAATAAPGTSTTGLATTAFVTAAITAAIAGIAPGVTTFNGRSGAVTLGVNDISAAGGAVLSSPAFIGIPTAPTAALGVSTTQLATTAFVAAAVAAMAAGVSSFNTRTGAVTLTLADITSAGGAPLASPGFSGVPTAPTAAANTSTTQLATTAFVTAAIASGGVVSFNGRSGAVTLAANDVSAVGGALLASPTFTGVPAAPTAAPGVSTTQLATTAFVTAAIAAGGGVASFNGRAGAVTLTTADVSAAGGPYLPLTGGNLTGNLGIMPASGQPDADFYLNKTTGQNVIWGRAGASNLNRWAMIIGNNTAETGSNAGSDFTLLRYDDTGSYIGSPLSINRSTGLASLANGLAVQGALSGATGTLNVSSAMAVSGLTTATGTLISGGSIQIRDTGSGSPQLIFTDGTNNIGTNIHHVLSSGAFYIANEVAGGLGLYIDTSGNINASTANPTKPGGGPWLASSDQRIKKVEKDYSNGLASVLTLRPVVYHYLGNDTPTETLETPRAPYPDSPHHHPAKSGASFIGLVAQEIEKAFPEMVKKNPGFIDGKKVADLRTLDSGPLIFALVNATKELAARVTALENIRR